MECLSIHISKQGHMHVSSHNLRFRGWFIVLTFWGHLGVKKHSQIGLNWYRRLASYWKPNDNPQQSFLKYFNHTCLNIEKLVSKLFTRCTHNQLNICSFYKMGTKYCEYLSLCRCKVFATYWSWNCTTSIWTPFCKKVQ